MISVLIPTRGRYARCINAIDHLFSTATNPKNIEVLLGIDTDDTASRKALDEYCKSHENVTGILFHPMGYDNLNYYYLYLAFEANGDWLFIYNDDCEMRTDGWDEIIESYTGKFLLLSPWPKPKKNLNARNKFKTLFPIVPKEWLDATGRFSAHPANDTWLQVVAVNAGIFERVNIRIDHDRPKDETAAAAHAKISFESKEMEDEKRVDERKLIKWAKGKRKK